MTEVTDKDRSIAGFVAHIVAAHNGKTSGQLENYIARVQMMAAEKATKEARERIKEMRKQASQWQMYKAESQVFERVQIWGKAFLERTKEFA